MEERSQRISLLLIFVGAVMAGYAYLTQEAPAEAPDAAPTAESSAADSARPAAVVDAAAREEAEEHFTVVTDEFEAELSNLHTGVTHVRLLGDRFQNDGEPTELVTTWREPYLPLTPRFDGLPIPADAVWEGEQVDPRTVRFVYRGEGYTVVRKVEAGSGPYQLWATTRVQNDGTSPLRVAVNEGLHHWVARSSEESSGIIGRPSVDVAYGMCEWGDEEDFREDREELLETYTGGPEVAFVAVDDTYFALALAPREREGTSCSVSTTDLAANTDSEGSLFDAQLTREAATIAPGESSVTQTLFFAGPKLNDALLAAGHDLGNVVDLGFFGFIGRGLVKALRVIHGAVTNWGIAIILLTFLVKLLLYPLTAASFQSMAKMRQLQPEIEKLNEKHGDDREAKGQAMMQLYQKHKVNPLAGCLPMLFQMPVYFALYQSLSTNAELFRQPFFGWYVDLTAPDPFYLLPLLLGAQMFVQQKLAPASAMDETQAKIMLYGMPIFMTAIMLFLPAGLCLYMCPNSALSLAQQRWIYHRLDKQTSANESAESSDAVAEETDRPANSKPKGKKRKRRA